MKLIHVRADVLRAVHSRLIQAYGGTGGVRDENALESAVARPRQLEHYTGEVRVAALAAALAWAILRNHPFIDGNKRVALAALVISAEINGHRLTCGEPEETAMILKAAAASITEEEWATWALRVVALK